MHDQFNGDKPLLLVFPYDVMAHYLRCLQLAIYFSPWFNIKFIYSARYHAFVAGAGFETFEAAALDADKVQRCIQSFDFSWLNERDLSHIYKDQVRIIKQLKPAAVLGDMAPTLKMAAEKTGLCYLSLTNGYMSRHYAYVRRMPRSYPLYNLFSLLPTSLYTYFTNIGEHLYFQNIHRPFSKIRKCAGLSAKHSYMQELEGDVNLVCDLPELFPQRDLPKNFLFIPPLFHPLDNHNEDFTTRLDAGRKTLFVSMGSTGEWKKVSFLNNTEYRQYNIVTAGDKYRIVKGVNVHAYDFINDSKVFSIIDLVICHGGSGTCYQALSYGIPVLGIASHLEQEYNLDGLERCQLGKNLNDIPGNNYTALIEEMIDKKRNNAFTWIQQKIALATSRFEETLPGIVTLSLNKHETNTSA
jgi:UDP:flavonoid glycosyltransferase YjiC (YdhE family)